MGSAERCRNDSPDGFEEPLERNADQEVDSESFALANPPRRVVSDDGLDAWSHDRSPGRLMKSGVGEHQHPPLYLVASVG